MGGLISGTRRGRRRPGTWDAEAGGPAPAGRAEVVHVRCFGSLEVRAGKRRLGPRDLGGVKGRHLLEILVAARGRVVSKHRIADLLWGEATPRQYVATIESHMSVLRRRLRVGLGTEPAIMTEPGGYRIDPTRVRLDLDDFDELLTTRAVTSSPMAAEQCLLGAVDLVRGDVFEDEPYAVWAEDLRYEYRPRIVRALLDAASDALARADLHGAQQLAQRVIAMDPAVEAAYQIQMLICCQQGRQDESLRLFERCREVLARELAVEPLDCTVELAEAIRHHDHEHLSSLGVASPMLYAQRAS